MNLTYSDTGSGAPIVLLHAFPLNSAMWVPQVAELSQSMRVIIPDLRGFGTSQLNTPPATLDTYALDIITLLNRLGLEQVTIAGLSMGGYVAFAMLRHAPQRIARLILADTRAGADSAEAKQGREANAILAEQQGVLAVGNAMLPRLVAASASEALREQIRTIMSYNSAAGVAAALRSMAARPDSSETIAAITVPTLIIVGSEDVLTPPSEAEAMQHLIPHSHLVVIPGAGHLANLEAPEAFNQAILDFVATT
ncbi:MAG: alpha/beta fold hydrolase [Roseiflexaceae bacterium]